MDWAEFLALSPGVDVQREPSRLEVLHGEARTETESYELVVEDEAPSGDESVITAAELAVDLPDPDRDPRMEAE